MAITMIGIALLFFLGHGLNWFFDKTKIPDLLILIAIGYLLGPILGVLSAEDFGKAGPVVSTMALIVILYEGGLQLSAKDLMSSSLPSAALSIMSFLFIAVAGALLSYIVLFNPLPISILFGVAIGSTSSAIVIPMVKKLSIQQKNKVILSLESAFTDVLTIVIFLVLVESFARGQFDLNELLVGIGPKTALSAVIGIVAGLIWAFFKKRFAPILSMAFAGEAWALLLFGLMEFFTFNGAIAVLTLGFTLANLNLLPKWLSGSFSAVPVSYKDLSILSELTFLLRTFFFIYLGLLIKFSNVKIILFALLISVVVLITRYIAIKLLYSNKKYTLLDTLVATAMGPRGLACAVLATIPLQKGIEGGQWLQDTLFSLIPITITFTAIFVSFSESKSGRSKLNFLFKTHKEELETIDLVDTEMKESIEPS